MAPPGEHTTRRTVLRRPRAPAAPAIWPDTKRGEDPARNPDPRARPQGGSILPTRVFPGPGDIDNVYGPAGRTHSSTTAGLDAKRREPDSKLLPSPREPLR